MENLKSVVPNCLEPKFNRPKVATVRSFPEKFDKSILQQTHEDIHELEIETIKMDVAVIDKLVYGENNVISSDDRAMEVEPVAFFEQKADTLVYELKTRECDTTKPKRRKVSSLRDFPKDVKSYEVVDKKSQEHCMGRSGCDVETNDGCNEHLKVVLMSEGGLVDPVVGAFSCGEEFVKQEQVVTVELEAVLQSDVDLELNDEAFKDEETIGEFECGEHDNKSFSMVENVSLVETASEDAENFQLLYPCRFPKRRKVSAVRDFPDALKILKAHNGASEKKLDHRADKLAGKNETTCDSQDDVEHNETEIESQESSAPTEKGLSRNLMTSLTPTKDDTVNLGANTVYKPTSVGHDDNGADKQELANCGAYSTTVSTQSSSEVTNSNKRIGGKEVGVKCINKAIVEDSMATPRCPSMPSQCDWSNTKTNQDKGKDKVLKRKQNEGSAPITVVLALMAPTKCPR